MSKCYFMSYCCTELTGAFINYIELPTLYTHKLVVVGLYKVFSTRIIWQLSTLIIYHYMKLSYFLNKNIDCQEILISNKVKYCVCVCVICVYLSVQVKWVTDNDKQQQQPQQQHKHKSRKNEYDRKKNTKTTTQFHNKVISLLCRFNIWSYDVIYDHILLT